MSAIGIVVAALGGLAIGIERQRSGHATGHHAHLGGIRTFTLLGGIAGAAGWLAANGFTGLGLALDAGATALVVAGYISASRRDVDATTEAAALVVIAAGTIAGLGWLALASGTVSLCALLLVEKSELHAMVRRIDDNELRATARFAVMAVVVLPLLPEGPIGPWGGIKPRELWLLVLFFSGLSFAGYLAGRVLGPREGYPAAGLLGGLISSTNVTYTFARLSRREPALSQPLALGTVVACTVLVPRVLLTSGVLNPGVARALLPYVIPPFAVGLVAILLWMRTSASHPGQLPKRPSNPLQVGPALQMAALFQIVLFAVRSVRAYVGDSGIFITAAVLGLTDVDALTISMSKVVAADGQAEIAAEGIAIGVLANTVLKIGLAIVLGAPHFRRLTAGVIAAMAIVAAIAVAVLH